MNNQLCPCGNSKTYENCCEIIHQDISKASTAEELMRSRYSAFAKANGDYLYLSHHSSTRPNSYKKTEKWAKSVQWIKLEIQKSTKGTQNENEGTVEFTAYFMENGKIDTIQEHSTFEKENGHWVYLDRLN